MPINEQLQASLWAQASFDNSTFFADCELVTFEEVSNDIHWINAMNEEIRAIEKNDTWELTRQNTNQVVRLTVSRQD